MSSTTITLPAPVDRQRAILSVMFAGWIALVPGSLASGQDPARPGIWTDPTAAQKENPDFSLQGEYQCEGHGMQVVARGEGKFEAWYLEGGLPGAGGKGTRVRMHGIREGEKVELANEETTLTATLTRHGIDLRRTGGAGIRLERCERKSPTLGARPPHGAKVLFDGSNIDAWTNATTRDGLLLATGASTKEHFGSYTLHLEFRTPYMPGFTGQKRGNSGVFHAGRWETQILDSFGLEGRDNECGGIYSIAKPRLNMAFPPLVWQTYDVEFKAAGFDATGKLVSRPRITVRLNGVLIHEDLELLRDFTPSAPLSSVLAPERGPLHLQNHGDPVVFRNIWLLPGGE